MTINFRYWKTRVVRYPLLALSASAALVITGLDQGLGKSDWAAWVQAIGSIAALGVAIFVMSRQNQHAAKLLIVADKRALIRRADAVSATIERAHTQLPQVCQIIFSSTELADDRMIRACMSTATFATAELQSAIRAIPAHELGSYEMVSGLYKTIEVLSIFETMVDNWLQEPQLPPTLTLQAFLIITCNSCEEAKAVFLLGVEKLKDV